jgi:uncharacterized protein with FMN-binding domain
MTTFNKILLGVVIIIGIGGYVYWSGSQSSSASSSVTATTSGTSAASETLNPNASGTVASSGGTAPSTSGSSGSGSSSAGAFKDGTYTGSVANNSIYGPVQVSATIKSGKLTDVTFLQYPSDQEHSVEVSNMSMPILKSEAIASQSASVNIVSGATQTSEAFQQTLQSALSQAQA